MEIISLSFLGFVLVSSLINLVVPKKFRNPWLLFVSVLFYLTWDIRFVLVLVILTFVNYWFISKIQTKPENKKYSVCLFIFNIGMFVLVKILSSHYISTAPSNMFLGKVLLPVGFSYYMLQMISIHLDIVNKRITTPSLIDFSLYLFYFPKLLSGPIEKPKSFFVKLENLKFSNRDNHHILLGINLICMGLIRKLFIANILIIFLPDYVSSIDSLSWSHVLGFVIYVYNDFAGYTLIVRGVSCFFGIELSPNFTQPLLSRNFSEFWNRWHITLSTWLRENIYFPLSRKLNRMQNIPLGREVSYILPPLLTMIASGFWHGASLALLLWGSVFGLFMIFERIIFEKWPNIRKATTFGIGSWISRVLIFILFSLAMVPLCINSTKASFKVWFHLFTRTDNVLNDAVLPVLVLGLFSFALDYFIEKSGKEIWWEKLPVVPRAAIIAFGIILIVVSFILIYFYPSSVFIYQGF